MSEEATSWGKRVSFLPNKNVQAVLGTGAADIAAASRAVAAATGSGTFSVDPDTVDRMIIKLAAMQDELAAISRRSRELSQDTKLGEGYARKISTHNAEFGEEVTRRQIADIAREIGALKSQIEKSRASYQSADQAHSDSFKNLNGKS